MKSFLKEAKTQCDLKEATWYRVMSSVISYFKEPIWVKTWSAQNKSHIWKILEERAWTRSYLLEKKVQIIKYLENIQFYYYYL